MIKNCETCVHWKPGQTYLTNFFGKRGTATDYGRRHAQCARFQTYARIAMEYYCGRNLNFWQSAGAADEGMEN